MRWLFIVPVMLVCALGYAADESPPDLSYVPTGLEISEGRSAAGAIIPMGGIAQMITSAAGEKNWLPDFSFVRGADLKWESWFAPSARDADEW